MLHRPPWTNHRTPGAIPGSGCGRSEERSGVTAVGGSSLGCQRVARETVLSYCHLEPSQAARSHGL